LNRMPAAPAPPH